MRPKLLGFLRFCGGGFGFGGVLFGFFCGACFFLRGFFLLGLNLRARHLFYDDFFYFHVGNIVIVDNLLDDLLYEFGAHDLVALWRRFVDAAAVVFEKAFENNIIIDKIRVHLKEVVLVKFERGVADVDGVAHLVVAFEEVPEVIAFAVVGVFHHEVCALNGAVHRVAAVHEAVKPALAQRHNKAAHTVNSFKDLHVFAVVFGKALLIFDGHFDLVLDFFIRVVDFVLHHKGACALVACRPEYDVRAFINKSDKALYERVDKTVFVKVIALLAADIEDARGLNFAVVVRSYKLCVFA